MDSNHRVQYWENNIERWNSYYHLSHSEEELSGPRWFRFLYKIFLVPIEAWLMKKRFQKTIAYLDKFIDGKSTFVDLGCGAGLFSEYALPKAKKVIAVDFAKASVNLTKEGLTNSLVAPIAKYEVLLIDLRHDQPPVGDVALAMGLAPYIEDIEPFLQNVLSSTTTLCCNYVNPRNPFNILRRFFPVLNVRGYVFHDPGYIENIVSRLGFQILKRERFATGYIDIYVKSD
jgi:SAM-dependent methyltransferase